MSNYETFDNNLNKQAMQEDLELKMVRFAVVLVLF